MASLGSQAVGSIVKLNENGVAADFLVVHQGLPSSSYDSSCDGTWLLRKDIKNTRTWKPGVYYSESGVCAYLENDYFASLDPGVQSVVKQVKIPATINYSNKNVGNIDARVFLLSVQELGTTNTTHPLEGSVLSYFSGGANATRIAYLSGVASNWMSRSIYGNSSSQQYYYVYTNGGIYSFGVTGNVAYGVRPAMILPSDIEVDGGGNVTVESGGISGQVPINGVMCDLTGEGYININGVLCPISDSGVNIGGIINSTKG